MEKLVWIKDIGGSKVDILLGNEKIGFIQGQNLFSSKARAVFNRKNFFLKRDILLSKFEIYDCLNQALLASVEVNLFNPKSDVIINGKRFELDIKNLWQSKWAWKFNGSEIISFTTRTFFTGLKGDIELFTTCKEEVEILILLGLFIRNPFIWFVISLLLVLILILIF